MNDNLGKVLFLLALISVLTIPYFMFPECYIIYGCTNNYPSWCPFLTLFQIFITVILVFLLPDVLYPKEG